MPAGACRPGIAEVEQLNTWKKNTKNATGWGSGFVESINKPKEEHTGTGPGRQSQRHTHC